VPLPDRAGLLARLEMMLLDADDHVGPSARRGAPALILVVIDRHEALVGLDPPGAEESAGLIERRLDRLVRSTDLLARLAPDTYVLAAGDVEPTAVGSLVERVRSAFALPIEIGGSSVSLSVTVAVEFVRAGEAAVDLLDRAEQGIERPD
jgi:GGDEF domain-containing protein